MSCCDDSLCLIPQPAHHHNPLRDPYPSISYASPGKMGDVLVDKSLVSQLDDHWQWWYYQEEDMIEFWDNSPALREDDFRPIGTRSVIPVLDISFTF